MAATEENQPATQEQEGATPPVTGEEEAPVKEGLMRRLNPMRMFRKESADMYIKEGNSLMENQNLALATMAFQKAIALEPDNVEAHKGMGHVLMKKGGRTNMASALTQFQAALKINPFDDRLYALTSRILEKLGKMKEATLEKKKMMVIKTLQSDPKNPIANNNMGILMLQQGNMDQALTYFRQSIASNPNYDVANRNLAAAYYQLAVKTEDDRKQEYIEQAKVFINKAINIDDSAISKVIYGKILMIEGRLEEALGICEAEIERDPSNGSIFALKRMVLEKMNRTQEAQKAYETMVSAEEGPQ